MSGDAIPQEPEAPPRARGFNNVPVEPGDAIGGRYVVERVIGAGGVGVIVSARETSSGEGVAIKLLQRSACSSEENLARFDREGRALARLKSPHVARVIDVGALPTGEPYIVMERLDGDDLAAVIRREAPVEVARAVSWVVQACEAVVEAHAVGVIHRDLKPANLFLCRGPEGEDLVKVLDFGISKLLRDAAPGDQGLTQATSVIGSPLYMSPEQMESPAEADERSDIWALGTLLYELLTGQAPFDAPTMPLLCAAICTGAPRPIQSLSPEVPTALAGVIHRCLANQPADRYQSVAELCSALAPFGPASATAAAERVARVALDAGLPVSEDALDAAGPVSAIREVSALRSGGAPLLDDESTSDGPQSSRRRWSWSSAPPPPLGPTDHAVPTRPHADGPGLLLKQVVGATLAACVALYGVATFSAREAPLSIAQRGVWHVAHESRVVRRLAVADAGDGSPLPGSR